MKIIEMEKKEVSAMKDAVAGLKRDFKDIIEFNLIRAEICRKMFIDLTDQGFTDEQALRIVIEKVI